MDTEQAVCRPHVSCRSERHTSATRKEGCQPEAAGQVRSVVEYIFSRCKQTRTALARGPETMCCESSHIGECAAHPEEKERNTKTSRVPDRVFRVHTWIRNRGECLIHDAGLPDYSMTICSRNELPLPCLSHFFCRPLCVPKFPWSSNTHRADSSMQEAMAKCCSLVLRSASERLSSASRHGSESNPESRCVRDCWDTCPR